MSYRATAEHVRSGTAPSEAQPAASTLADLNGYEGTRTDNQSATWITLLKETANMTVLGCYGQTVEQDRRCFILNSTSALSVRYEFQGIFESHAKEIRPASGLIDKLERIQAVFGDSASDLAKILRVTRPMIYHYRNGMQPTPQNRRRLYLIAELASKWSLKTSVFLGDVLHHELDDGVSFLEHLSLEELNTPLLDQAAARLRAENQADKQARTRLADSMAQVKRVGRKVMNERAQAGKISYVSDRKDPQKIFAVHPDGKRIAGAIIDGQFVPNENR